VLLANNILNIDFNIFNILMSNLSILHFICLINLILLVYYIRVYFYDFDLLFYLYLS